MAHLVLIEDGEQVGYVDTEAGEGEYNGPDPAMKGLIDDQVGKYLGGPEGEPGGPDAHFDGEDLEAYVRSLPEEYDRVNFVVRERDPDFEPPR